MSENLIPNLAESIALFVEEANHFPNDLRREKPSEIAFSATEIVYHMVDVEKLWQFRFAGVLNGSLKTFEAMNPDQVASESAYNTKDYKEGIDLLQSLRKNTIEVISQLTPEQFELSAVHARYGEMNIRRMLEIIYNHDLTHKAQLARTLTQVQEVAAK